MQKPPHELELYKYCPHCGNTLTFQTVDNQKIKQCGQCGFIFWNNPKPVVSILLHKEGKVLMLQRAEEPLKKYWVLPGGFVMYEETPEEAIKREAKEETGLEIFIEGLIGVYRIDNDPRGIHIDSIFYGTAQKEVILSEEDKTWRYFSQEELPSHIAYKHRNAINDWYRKRKN